MTSIGFAAIVFAISIASTATAYAVRENGEFVVAGIGLAVIGGILAFLSSASGV